MSLAEPRAETSGLTFSCGHPHEYLRCIDPDIKGTRLARIAEDANKNSCASLCEHIAYARAQSQAHPREAYFAVTALTRASTSSSFQTSPSRVNVVMVRPGGSSIGSQSIISLRRTAR
jgi:hypothetical protein